MKARSSRGRRGIAFLLLVFMLLVIVMGCVQLMIQHEVSDRRFSRHQRRVGILRSAIEIAAALDVEQPIALPVSKNPDRKVLVSFDETTESWVAVWLKDNLEIDSLIQKKI